MRKPKGVKIRFLIFAKLYSIFITNGWPTENSTVVDNVFDDFCDMLSRLDEQQQELILELTKDFLWLGANKYAVELQNVCNNILAENESDIIDSAVYHVMPLLSMDDIGKSKSSTFLEYLINCNKFRIDLFRDKKLILHNDYQSIVNSKGKLQNSIIFLVDDFIGSGETATAPIQYLLDNGINKDKIIVLCLVAQHEGVMHVQELGVRVYASQIRVKGISDKYAPDEAEKRLEIMDSIETKIKVKPVFKYGFKNSQALVTMGRTPNNTFPIYWLTSDAIPKVPFRR